MICPNCGGHIGRFELDQNCKHCGVNLFYSQQEKLLSEDAKRCELEYASFRIWVAKLKGAFVGSKIAIIRIVSVLLPVLCLFIPFASASVTLWESTHKLSFSGYGIYKFFSDGSINALLNSPESVTALADLKTKALILAGAFAAVLIAALLLLAAEFLSFINLKSSAKAQRIFAIAGAVLSAVSFAASLGFASGKISGTLITSSFGVGAPICLLAFLFAFLVNTLYIKKDIKADIKQVDLDRVAVRKKVRSGEISIDDLPLPVFESEEEKEKRLKEEERVTALENEAKGGAR